MEPKIDLQAYLNRKNMNQAELSRLINTTPENVSRWVKGKGVPSYENWNGASGIYFSRFWLDNQKQNPNNNPKQNLLQKPKLKH